MPNQAVWSLFLGQAALGKEAIDLKTKLVATVSEITPICGNVDGKIIMRTTNIANLELTNFYCNWMAIGNVVANIKLSIDGIRLNEQSFTVMSEGDHEKT